MPEQLDTDLSENGKPEKRVPGGKRLRSLKRLSWANLVGTLVIAGGILGGVVPAITYASGQASAALETVHATKRNSADLVKVRTIVKANRLAAEKAIEDAKVSALALVEAERQERLRVEAEILRIQRDTDAVANQILGKLDGVKNEQREMHEDLRSLKAQSTGSPR